MEKVTSSERLGEHPATSLVGIDQNEAFTPISKSKIPSTCASHTVSRMFTLLFIFSFALMWHGFADCWAGQATDLSKSVSTNYRFSFFLFFLRIRLFHNRKGPAAKRGRIKREEKKGFKIYQLRFIEIYLLFALSNSQLVNVHYNTKIAIRFFGPFHPSFSV